MQGYADYERNWRGPERPARNKGAGAAKAPAERPPASTYLRLLREFANEQELQGFYGFGSESTDAQTTTPHGKIPPVDPKLYVRRNNDYAALLQQFTTLPKTADGQPIERLIITDGVQSHRDVGAGSALNQTVTELQNWIAAGGVVEVRKMTAPFAGTYYSEELRARNMPVSFAGRVPDRPFVIISLLSSAADLPAWDRFWARDAMSGLGEAEVVRCPVASAAQLPVIEPEERISKDAPVDVVFRNVWDLARMVTLDGYQNVWRARLQRIRTADSAEPPKYPASFLLKGIKASSEADAAAQLRAMKPTLEVWQEPTPRRPSGDGKALAAAPSAPGTAWQKVESVDLRDFQNGRVTVKRLPPPADAFRFLAALDVPTKGNVRAVALTATPPAADSLPPPDWKSASTLDDSTADSLNRIYNLQPFVEQLVDRTAQAPPATGLLVLTYR